MAAEKHASVKLYWIFCLVLCVMTFIEWGLFKVESLRSNSFFMLPTLLGLSVIKFVMVCGWYMHLRYDHKILTKFFGFSILLAIMVYSILMFSLHY
jgi:cytochrome c oxidase subunit 4